MENLSPLAKPINVMPIWLANSIAASVGADLDMMTGMGTEATFWTISEESLPLVAIIDFSKGT